MVEFLVLTRWASHEAIRGFAGPDIEKAVVEPAAHRALELFDSRVRHYKVLLDTPYRAELNLAVVVAALVKRAALHRTLVLSNGDLLEDNGTRDILAGVSPPDRPIGSQRFTS